MDVKQYSIEGEGRDEAGRRYFKIAVEGSQTPLIIAADSIVKDSKELFAALTRKSKTALLEELQSFSSDKPSFRVVTKVGHSNKQFVLPTQTFGTSSLQAVTVLDHLDPAMTTKYRSRGTLEEWQTEIAAACYGNTRCMFTVALAFAGPILPYVK
jgi:uncharacterized protein (DUF927 family)